MTAYTVPLSSTVATLDLFDFHCGGRPEDVDACKVFSVSGDSVIFVWLSLISGFFTVTRQVVFVPSAVIVIYVLPGFSPQTFPESVTEATLGFLDLNWGCERLDVVARSWQNSPCSSDKEEELNWIFVLLTVTIQRASAPGTFAVIFAWPPFFGRHQAVCVHGCNSGVAALPGRRFSIGHDCANIKFISDIQSFAVFC